MYTPSWQARCRRLASVLLYEPRFAYATVMALAAAVGAAWLWLYHDPTPAAASASTVRGVRLTGGLMQLFGFGFTLLPLLSTPSDFGRPGLLKSLIGYPTRLGDAWRGPPALALSANQTIEACMQAGLATGGWGPDTPTELKLKILQDAVNDLRAQLLQLSTALEAEKRSTAKRLQAERDLSSRELSAVEERAASRALRPFGLQLGGVALFVAGTILGSFTDEVARLVEWASR